MIDVGVITKKKIAPITMGEIKLPKIIPNRNHILLRGPSIFELIKPKNKKTILRTNDQTLILPSFKKG